MYKKVVLDNGLRVLTSSMRHTRSVTASVFIGAGSRYESDEMGGVCHYLEHMLFKGTKRWPTAKDLSEAIEGVGGIMNGSTDHELTIYWCKVATPYFQRVVQVLADMVLHPVMSAEEFDKERNVVLEELRMTNDQPSHRVDLLIDEAMWPNHALGRDVGGTIGSVTKLTRDDLLKFMYHQYSPTNVVVAVTGDISHEDAIHTVNQAFSEWKNDTKPLSWFSAPQDATAGLVKFERRKTDQAYICLGMHAIGLDHPDRYPLSLTSVVLGEGMSSRLFVEVREKRALAYDVHSSVSMYRDCGAVVISCGVEPSKGEQAVEAIVEELHKLKQEIPAVELNKAKEMSKGRMLLRMEDSRSVAMWLSAQEMLTGRVLTVDDVVKKVDSVRAEDIQRVASTYMDSSKMNVAVVGPYRSPWRFKKFMNGRLIISKPVLPERKEAAIAKGLVS